MKALKYLSFVGKVAGLVSALNVIPFVDPTIGVVVFAAASILKDAVTHSDRPARWLNRTWPWRRVCRACRAWGLEGRGRIG